jgi:tetratricopeptide (TPR) repeat protein
MTPITNPDEKNAYALIVGIATYKDSKVPKLNCTTHDARAIFDLLVNPDMAGFKKENVKFFLDEEATLFNIKDAISNWLYKNAKEDSLVFIFFAGHGGVEEDRFGIEKDNLAKYLLLYDTDFDNFYASALSNSDFNRLLLSIKSRRLVVFMDSCYSGGVSERKARDVKIVDDPYEKMAEGEGRLVIAASQPDQRSFEDANMGHGIFTHHLIEALKGAADFDNDGYVKAMEVYKYLSDAVPETALRLAGGIQEPILRGDLKTDFVLTVNRKRIEEIKHKDAIKKSLKRLFDWRYEEELIPEEYELACRLIESSPEELSEDDKKALKSLNDLLSDKISISTFRRDVGIIKGLEEQPIVKPEFDEEEEKKKQIIELSSQAQKLFEEKMYTAAIAKWQGVLKLDSKNRGAIKGIEESERILEEVKEKKRKIDELNASAQQLHDEGKYSEAIDKWKDIIRGKYSGIIDKWKGVTNVDLEKQTAREGIKKAEEKLKETKREVNDGRVKKYCPKCGHSNTRRLKYCVQCGAKLFEAPDI